MKRLTILLVTITASLLFLQNEVRGAEIMPVYLSPRPGAKMVQAESMIALRFAEAVDAGTAADTRLHVRGSISGGHEGDLFVARDGRTVIFAPEKPFAAGETVNVRLNGGLLSTQGDELSLQDYEFTITSHAEEISQPVPFLPAQDRLGIIGSLAAVLNRNESKNAYMTLPDSFPEITVTSPANGTASGYVFISNFVIDWSRRGSVAQSRPYLLILDNEGEPVFYREMTPGVPTMDFKKQPNGLLTYAEWNGIHYAMDSSYSIVKTFEAKNGYPRNDIHDFQILPDDHVLINIYDMKRVDMTAYGGKADAVVTGLVIQEQDPDGNVVFEWRSWDHFRFEESAANLTGAFVDPVHGNSFELDHDGNLIISSRRMNEVTKINRETGEIIWRLGGKANEFTFVNDPDLFFSQHDARRMANGKITIFDNHDLVGSTFARAVEYELDETGPNKTATLVWEHRSSAMSAALGNAQRLPNGNTMIGWGTLYPTLSEVKPNGDIAFELTFSAPDKPNLIRNSYRAFRFDWQGQPVTDPLLIGIEESPGIASLYTSWNGATDVAAYQVYGGETAETLSLIKTVPKDGFETKITIADEAGEYCVFRVMPVDEEGREIRYSNIAAVRQCTVYEPSKADFAASPTSGAPPLEVKFTNLSTGDFDTCLWDFGDGGTNNSCDNPRHEYKDEGHYTISLAVQGPGGDDIKTVEKGVKVAAYRVFLPGVLETK